MFTDVHESKIRRNKSEGTKEGKEKEKEKEKENGDAMEVDEGGSGGSLKRKRDNMSGQKKDEVEKKKGGEGEGEGEEEGDCLRGICQRYFPSEVTSVLASVFWSLSFYDVYVPKGLLLMFLFIF